MAGMFRRLPAAAVPGPDPVLRAGRLALLTASALHLGFQSVVTSVVYPQLFEGPTHGMADRQADHARRIAPVAVAVYASTLGAATWAGIAALRAPGEAGRGDTAAACAAALLAPAITGGVAVPLHVGVAAEKTSTMRLQAILASDRVRTGIAAIGVAAAARALGS